MATKEITITPVKQMVTLLETDSVKAQFENSLQENAPLFLSSILDVYSSDQYLQKCAPGTVIKECLKAALLKLPISKGLGFAYIVPYSQSRKEGNKWIKELVPQLQVGYKGLLQLAMRSGQYKYINADVVYEGELQSHDKLTGELNLTGEPESNEIVGYFAYIETLNGFKKSIFWSKEKVQAHAKQYSKSFDSKKSAWTTNFEAMALKTVLKNLLGKYGIMSVEMVTAFTSDNLSENAEAEQAYDDIELNANSGNILDVDTKWNEKQKKVLKNIETASEQAIEGSKTSEKKRHKKAGMKITPEMEGNLKADLKINHPPENLDDPFGDDPPEMPQPGVTNGEPVFDKKAGPDF